jgi:enoyl-CoA hydratase/carnithine racemase
MNGNRPAIALSREGAVLVLSIDRFERRNAMNREFIDDTRNALLLADTDQAVRAVVLRGKGGGFCAGSDLRYIASLQLEQMARFEQECGDLGRLIGLISKPVVASVEGFAIGGGFALAACCDIVVAGRQSRWSMPEVPLGWLTPWGLKPLIERVGNVKARQLCYCLEELSASACQAIGLVDYVVDDGQADQESLRIAAKIASLPPAAVAATKRLFSQIILRDAETIDFEANRLFVDNCKQSEARATLEATRAKVAA